MKEESGNLLNFIWKDSLAGKFVTLTVVVVFIVMSINAFINYRSQKNIIIENIKSQSQMLGNFVSNISPEPLLSYDFDVLNDYMEEINKGEDVIVSAIFSPDGDAVTSYIKRNNRVIADFLLDKKQINLGEIIKYLQGKEHIILQRFPIIFEGQILGYFNVGISKTRVEAISRKKLMQHLAISCLFTALLGFAIYVVFRLYAMRPILKLVEAAKRIAIGKLDKKVTVYSRDELGRLAISFNQMMIKLKRGIEEKDDVLQQVKHLNQTLEERVEQRTSELELVNQKLEQMAMRDSLTNLPNRFCIQERLNQYIQDAKQKNTSISVIMIDLDRFKDINDTLGHDCGDRLLIEVSLRLREILRPTDFVGRLGGDEFAILLPDTGEEGATIVAEKVHRSLEPSFYLENMAFSVAASLGIAVSPEHGDSTSAILKSADIAMYHAKQQKLGYCFYHPDLDSNSADRLTLMGELRDAINKGELKLYYQPKVDLARQSIVGVEALVRWMHPTRGFIPPDEFVPMAEQSGLIRPLTHWVISTALNQCEIWHKNGIEISMSINLSVNNLQDVDFPAQVSHLLDITQVDNRFIQFEITESTIMTNPDYVQEVLVEMGKLNVSFAIDDFGTGYSSLSTLKKLPVHELKIDKSFVMDMASDSDDEAIVHSIIDMAHNLGLSVIAEGVENITVTKQLIRFGCDLIQGYYISPPMPEQKMTEMLENLSWNYITDPVARQQSAGVTVLKGNS